VNATERHSDVMEPRDDIIKFKSRQNCALGFNFRLEEDRPKPWAG
jgi:hypothetical protein